MEENQNGMNGNEAPRTYGEESRMYENGGQPGYNGQPNYESQPGYNGQPNYDGQANYGSQPGYNGQPNYESQPGYSGQPNYDSTQGYPAGYNPYQQQPEHGPVKDIFCNILLVIMPLRIIIGIFVATMMYGAMDSYESIMDGSYMTDLMSGSYTMLSWVNNLLLVAMIVFIILDIVKISKENYKITGLILFAIFLKPGYYIWRAHVLGRKKAGPIVYTVIFSLMQLGYYAYSFYRSFSMMSNLMQTMY